MTEHSPVPWKLCGEDGKHFCGHIYSGDGNSHIVKVIRGKWGDDYASLRFVEGTGGAGSLGPQIEAYMDQITYGEIPEGVAEANARFIVTACNSHAGLLEVAKEVVLEYESGPRYIPKDIYQGAIEAIRQVEETQ